MNNTLDDTEIDHVLNDLMARLFDESHRGAVIICAAVVEEYLKDFIISIIPSSETKYRNFLVEYPGPLSSFSAKLEMCYAFRLIDSNVYHSIRELKRLRNIAAHSNSSFDLKEKEESLNIIFDIGPNMTNSIKASGVKFMIDFKKRRLDDIALDFKITSKSTDEILAEYVGRDENYLNLVRQSYYWCLLVGVTLICRLISTHKSSTLSLLNSHTSWSSLFANKAENKDCT